MVGNTGCQWVISPGGTPQSCLTHLWYAPWMSYQSVILAVSGQRILRGGGASGIGGDLGGSWVHSGRGEGLGAGVPDKPGPRSLTYRPGLTHLMLNGSGVTVFRQACMQP